MELGFYVFGIVNENVHPTTQCLCACAMFHTDDCQFAEAFQFNHFYSVMISVEIIGIVNLETLSLPKLVKIISLNWNFKIE
jgi:hypothetical protein